MKKTKINLILICICILFGCGESVPMKKPFTIINIQKDRMNCGDNMVQYKYEDANCRMYWFCAEMNKYQIGQVIK